MIDFEKNNDRLVLVYETDFGPNDWVRKDLDEKGTVRLARTFHFGPDDLVEDSERDRTEEELDGTEEAYKFVLGTLHNGYYRISGDKLAIEHDLYLAEDLEIAKETFVATRNISIFGKIDDVTSEDLYIGGARPNALPAAEYDMDIRLLRFTSDLLDIVPKGIWRARYILQIFYKTIEVMPLRFEIEFIFLLRTFDELPDCRRAPA